jgi:hypothetical protein
MAQLKFGPSHSRARRVDIVIMVELHDKAFAYDFAVVSAHDRVLCCILLKVRPVICRKILQELLHFGAPNSKVEGLGPVANIASFLP